MRKLVILFVGLLFIVALVAIGCIDDSVDPSPIAAVSGTPTATALSGCETCHTDKALLKELAVEPPEEEEGEGGGG